MIVGPPAAPTARMGLLSLSTIVGLMLDKGRLPGATELASVPNKPKALGTPGAAAKSSISLFIITPVPGITTLDPKEVLIVAVMATQLPSLSAQEKWVVCLLNTSSLDRGGVPWVFTTEAFLRSILPANALAYPLSTSPLGTLAKAGSPNQCARSAKASFMDSVMR